MEEPKRPFFVRMPRRKAPRTDGSATPAPVEPVVEPAQDDTQRLDELHTRIVIPRQQRGVDLSALDVDLREVRYGAASKSPYLRVIPRQRQFTRVGAGHIEATRLASRPSGPIESVVAGIKRILLGSPFATSR